MKTKSTISIIINSGNEEKDIAECLESVTWADEVIVNLSSNIKDKTSEIVSRYQVKVIKQETRRMDFAAWHNQGIKVAKTDWLLWVDADERIPAELKSEILEVINNPMAKYSAYAIPRRNFLLGKELHWGGWYPDYAKRLFKKNQLIKWVGNLHEQPVFNGELGKLQNAMIHLQPNKIEPALEKSIKWSSIEAQLLYNANHKNIVWWRIPRMGFTTLYQRLIKQQGFRDGVEGWIESVYQMFHTMIVYLRLWELQDRDLHGLKTDTH